MLSCTCEVNEMSAMNDAWTFMKEDKKKKCKECEEKGEDCSKMGCG